MGVPSLRARRGSVPYGRDVYLGRYTRVKPRTHRDGSAVGTGIGGRIVRIRRWPVQVHDQIQHERRPAGLVRGAEPGAGVAVKVLVEEQQVAPLRVALEEAGVAVERPPPVAVEREK